MDFFVLPSALGPQELLERVKRYTHGDTFVPLEGRKTFTSHVHAHLVVNEMAGKRIHGNTPTQEFASVFKRMGINIVHLAEFHRQNEDGHFRNTDSIRLDE